MLIRTLKLLWPAAACTFAGPSHAAIIKANPANYTTFLSGLRPDDTLLLDPGTYTNNLTLKNLRGEPGRPIVIMGAGTGTVLRANACCNTVSLTQCAHLVLSRFLLDGHKEFVDAIKAEGTTGNWTHHVTIQYVTIRDYDIDQQAVGISTKCPSWNWIVRKNKILGAGTGMYFGNSDGTMPFVNGLIEYNYISNTLGYNLQIKHQLDGTRDVFPETMTDGHTTIRHNVFSKDSFSSTGGNARPNVLTGGFPLKGWGSRDYYEIYGNFFYNNPSEALFQGTGNIIMYANVFVNHQDPQGYRAIYFAPQNGVSPQNILFFRNTVWAANSTGGVRIYNPAPGYASSAFANAVFAANPVSGFASEHDNIKDGHDQAGKYVIAASDDIGKLDLYPLAGKLNGSPVGDSLARNYQDHDKDFNRDPYSPEYRGAYSGCCIHRGWKLQLDTIAEPFNLINETREFPANEIPILTWPNPFSSHLMIRTQRDGHYRITDLNGITLSSGILVNGDNEVYFNDWPSGFYMLTILDRSGLTSQSIIKK